MITRTFLTIISAFYYILICQLSIAQDTIITYTNKSYVGYIIKFDSSNVYYSDDEKIIQPNNQVKYRLIRKIKWSNSTLTNYNFDTLLINKYLDKTNRKSIDSSNKLSLNKNEEINKDDVLLSTYLWQEFKNEDAKRAFIEGIKDSKQFYDPTLTGGIVYVGSAIAAPLMLIPTLIISNTYPATPNCRTDDYEKFNNKNYTAGYKVGALKKKRLEVWRRYGEGTALNLATIILVVGIMRK